MKFSEKSYYILGKFLLYTRKIRNVKKKHIMLVSDHVKPRVAKIGYALRKKGFQVTLLLDKRSKNEIFNSDFRFYDYLLYFSNKEEAFSKCLLDRPFVYHIFSEAEVRPWSEYLIQNKSQLGKVVYDQYDVYRDFVNREKGEVVAREKYCMENADGLCCRMFETQYLKQKYDYKFTGKRILFFDYCWNKYKERNGRDKQNCHLKFIYGGRLIPINSNSPRAKIEWEGFKHIAETTKNNKDYFIIVPSQSCEGKFFRSYKNLKLNNPYFVLKEPMSFKELVKYESQMDYGIDCVEFQARIDEYETKLENGINLKAKMKYYATNKYFDYLDAGVMPIYGRQGELFGNYLARFGGAVWCSLEEMPDKMNELRTNRDINKKKACKAREVFAIENQIGRLIAFYKEI